MQGKVIALPCHYAGAFIVKDNGTNRFIHSFRNNLRPFKRAIKISVTLYGAQSWCFTAQSPRYSTTSLTDYGTKIYKTIRIHEYFLWLLNRYLN